MMIKIDIIINYVLALSIPKLIFLILKWTSKEGGAAIITSRLKFVSFDTGMEEGIGVFVLIGLISYSLSEYCMEKYFKKRIVRERKDGKLLTKDVLNRIDIYPISKSLRLKLREKYIFNQ